MVFIKKKYLLPFLLGFVFILNPFVSNISATNKTGSIFVGGLRRTFLLHMPLSYDASKSMPLLIVLHGGGGTGRNMVKLTRSGFDRIADHNGVVVVYPDGIHKHWNDDRRADETGYSVNEENVDDVGFISDLIDYLIKKMNIDRNRVYVTGMSNGAIMSYCLACRLSGKIAAIAPVAGGIPQNLLSSCRPAGTVSVVAINNVNDPLVPFAGGEVTGPFGKKKLGKVLSATESVMFWVRNNKCNSVADITYLPDKDPEDGTRIKKAEYPNGRNTSDVVLYTVEGGGHTWPGGDQYLGERIIGKTSRDMDATEVIWNFFEKHSLK